MSEQQLQDALIEAARLLGYLVVHFRPARTGRGWSTPLQGDVGFPDTVLAGHGRVIYVECKTAAGRLEVDQILWAAELSRAGCEVYLIRPAHWVSGLVERMLRGETTVADLAAIAAVH